MDNREWYLQFYGNSHLRNEFLLPVSYSFLNTCLFPLTYNSMKSEDDNVKAHLAYLGYERRNMSLLGDMLKLQKIDREISEIIGDTWASSETKVFFEMLDKYDLSALTRQLVINKSLTSYIGKYIELLKKTALHKSKSIDVIDFLYNTTNNTIQNISLNLIFEALGSEHNIKMFIQQLFNPKVLDSIFTELTKINTVVAREISSFDLKYLMDLNNIKISYRMIIANLQKSITESFSSELMNFRHSSKDTIPHNLKEFLSYRETIKHSTVEFTHESKYVLLMQDKQFPMSVFEFTIFNELLSINPLDRTLSEFMNNPSLEFIQDKIISSLKTNIVIPNQSEITNSLPIIHLSTNRTNIDFLDTINTQKDFSKVSLLEKNMDLNYVVQEFLVMRKNFITERAMRILQSKKLNWGIHFNRNIIVPESVIVQKNKETIEHKLQTNYSIKNAIIEKVKMIDKYKETLLGESKKVDKFKQAIPQLIKFLDTQKELKISELFKLELTIYNYLIEMKSLNQLEYTKSGIKLNSKLIDTLNIKKDVSVLSEVISGDTEKGVTLLAELKSGEREHINRQVILDYMEQFLRHMTDISLFDFNLRAETTKADLVLTRMKKVNSVKILDLCKRIINIDSASKILNKYGLKDLESVNFIDIMKLVNLDKDKRVVLGIYEILSRSKENNIRLTDVGTVIRYSKDVEIVKNYEMDSKIEKLLHKLDKVNKIDKGNQKELIIQELKDTINKKDKDVIVLTPQVYVDLIQKSVDLNDDLLSGVVSKTDLNICKLVIIDLKSALRLRIDSKMYLQIKSHKDLLIDLDFEVNKSSVDKIISAFEESRILDKELKQSYKTGMQEIQKAFRKLQLDSVNSLQDTDKDVIILNEAFFKKINQLSLGHQNLTEQQQSIFVNNTKKLLDKGYERNTKLLYEFIYTEMYKRWYFMPSDGPTDWMILPYDYPYSTLPVNGINTHPLPNGADKALLEIPVSIQLISDVLDFSFELWESHLGLYSRFTPEQALKHFVNLIYDWLYKYVPDKIYKMPSYYPEDYDILDNTEFDREDYWRIYRWIRWYAEAMIMNIPDADKNADGNIYIKKLLQDLVKYYNDHHGVYKSPHELGNTNNDKIKGIRHKWLELFKKLN